MHIPTKQKGKYFLEYFVNKYNSLKIIRLNLHNLLGDGSFCALKKSTKRTVPETKRGAPKRCTSFIYACAGLLGFGNYQFVALAVDVDDLNGIIILEVLAKLGDVYIHATCIEVVVINPD